MIERLDLSLWKKNSSFPIFGSIFVYIWISNSFRMNRNDCKMVTLCQVYLRIMRITLHAGHINHIPFFKSNLTRDIALKLNDLGKMERIFSDQKWFIWSFRNHLIFSPRASAAIVIAPWLIPREPSSGRFNYIYKVQDDLSLIVLIHQHTDLARVLFWAMKS